LQAFFYAQNYAMLASKWGGHKKREQREARVGFALVCSEFGASAF